MAQATKAATKAAQVAQQEEPQVNHYELKQIRGIPYYLRESTLYTFELDKGIPAASSIAIGTYDEKNNSITYYDNWIALCKPRLDEYRHKLQSLERDKLRDNIVKPVKKSRKGVRNPRKSAKDTGAQNK